MLKFIKKYKEYFITGGISLLILIILFSIKGIYPFGNNSLLYSDMNDQISSYYYYFYDAIKGNNSLLINFNASNGINFFGIIAYYILSPFSLLVLLVERSKIYLFISVIVALKMITCNLTCLYMIKKLFKNINIPLSIILAITYGFSAYALNYYQITPWIDAMYMLPLIVVGLKKLLDTGDSKMYILTLTLSLYFSFYISLMIIIFIFLLSLPYIIAYLKNKNIGQKILSLGISTILSIGSALVIIIPTYKQISISSRMISSLDSLINSKLGPLTDKIALFIFGPLAFLGIFLLLKDYKKHKKFLSFYVPSMILLLLPVIIEPINKLLHFGSYASFPYRFGFITTLFIIIGACYYFNNYKIKTENIKVTTKIISTIIVIISTILVVFITIYNYTDFQIAIDNLTLSNTKILFVMLAATFVITLIAQFTIYILNNGINKYSVHLLSILALVHIICNAYIYIGIEFIQPDVKKIYDDLSLIEKDNNNKTHFKYKNETTYLINNSSNVTRIPSLDHFSSLTDDSNQKNLKLLGYTSYWTQTHSKGGTLFSDILLGNKYIINNEEKVENYTLKKQYNNLYLHEYNQDISYGYLVEQNTNINKYNNTFDIQNAIYKSITNDDDLFTIHKPDNIHNISVNKKNYLIKDKDNFVEYNITIDKKSKIYLELYSSLDNRENTDIYELFNIYVNNELYLKNFPTKDYNGLVDFGTFEKEKVNIKIEFLDDCSLKSLNIGSLDMEKLEHFTTTNKLDYDIDFSNNKINISIDNEGNNILFIPINYNDSYTAYNNNNKTEIIRLYNNYIGIELNKGENNISIEFVPRYLKECFVISLLFIIGTIIILKTNIYNKLLNIKLLQKIAKVLYLSLYILVLIFIYILPTICFLISFVKYIKI